MSHGRTKKVFYTAYNRASLVSGGKAYFDRLEMLIRGAQKTVHLQTYIYDDDETGNKVAEALMAAAKRGVRVYILLDGYASQHLSSVFINTLKEAGIHFSFFEPLLRSKNYYFGRRLHYKVIVADASRCLVGGRNISNRYNDMPGIHAWLDWAVYAEGEVAAGLQDICVKRWNNHCPKTEKINDLPISPYKVEEECNIRIRVNDWVNRKTEVLQAYMQMFATAKHEVIVMTSYFWPGSKLVNKMSEAAARGVKVKLVLASISDVKLAKLAERYMYRWLFKKNVEIYEYRKNVLHGKIAVCDKNWVTIGSYNVNNISARASVELNLDIINEAFAATTHKDLVEIINNDCVLITSDAYGKEYNFLTQLLQHGAFILLNILFFVFTFYFRRQRKHSN